MTAMEEAACGECRFWERLGGELGECHRRAPAPLLEQPDPQGETLAVLWPTTYSDQWCGEWERRKEDCP